MILLRVILTETQRGAQCFPRCAVETSVRRQITDVSAVDSSPISHERFTSNPTKLPESTQTPSLVADALSRNGQVNNVSAYLLPQELCWEMEQLNLGMVNSMGTTVMEV
jgi:hypothetical protein